MKQLSFRNGIKALGFEVLKYNKGYNFRSLFATDKGGQLWYFSIEDLRDARPRIMRRTAESLTDYRGGANRWDVEDMAEQAGIKIVERRGKSDYNSL